MPAPTTVFSFHVNGPTVPQFNIGLSGAMVPVGVCEDGVDMTFRVYTRDIKFDGAGGPEGAEAENIFLNVTCDVRFALVPYGGTYLNILRSYAQAGQPGTADGVMNMPGALYGLNAALPSLYIPTIFDVDGGYLFTTGRLTQMGDVRVGVKETKPVFNYRAFNYIDPALYNTIFDRVLYQRQ